MKLILCLKTYKGIGGGSKFKVGGGGTITFV